MLRSAAPVMLLSMLAAAPAVSSPAMVVPIWSIVDGWTVRIDAGLNNGCFMATELYDGMQVRIGVDGKRMSVHLLIAHPSWRSLRPGRDQALSLQLDADMPQQHATSAVRLRGMMGLLVNLGAFNGLADLLTRQELVIRHDGRVIAQVSLLRSRRAGAELLSCQKAMNAASAGTVPLAGGTMAGGGGAITD